LLGTVPVGRQAPIGHCTKPHTLAAIHLIPETELIYKANVLKV